MTTLWPLSAETMPMNITRAYIHEYGNGKMEPEHRDVADVLQSRGIPFALFTTKKILRNRLALDEKTLVAGDHTVMAIVLNRLGLSVNIDSYPPSLHDYLGRKIWTSTIRDLLIADRKKNTGIFVKPKSKTKLFTGFVIQTDQDVFRLQRYPMRTELYFAETVNWISEYRVFVIHGEIVGVKNYAGDPNLRLDIDLVKSAIADFEHSSESTAGYGIDFGVLASGETRLVEWNDGFALGSYGLDKELYTDLLVARWEELLAKAPKRNSV